jgi:hypothetical protein
MLPLPRQARQQVLQLSQLDLQFAGEAARPLGEDVENELAAVDHLDAQGALEVALLRRRQAVVENRDLRGALLHQGTHLLHLSRADEGGRMDTAHGLQRRACHFDAGGLR